MAARPRNTARYDLGTWSGTGPVAHPVFKIGKRM